MTVQAAVSDVVTKLQAANLTRGDTQPLAITRTDPLPGGVDRPGMVAVTFAGMDDTEWFLTVRLYADTSSDLASAETFTQTTTPALDVALDGVPCPRSAWRKAWSADLNAYVVETTLSYPRDDF